MKIRAGDQRDADTLLAMFDDAVAWLTQQGRGDQWGTRPWSQHPASAERVRQMATDEELWIAEIDHRPAGALILTEQAPAYVPPASQSELYVLLLITARAYAGLSLGSTLLAHAREQARDRGLPLIRVDCWAGANGKLVDYYRRAGFTPTVGFTHHGWSGQVLEQKLPLSSPPR